MQIANGIRNSCRYFPRFSNAEHRVMLVPEVIIALKSPALVWHSGLGEKKIKSVTVSIVSHLLAMK